MTNFDTYLDQQLENPAFASRFVEAGAAWEKVARVAEGTGRKDTKEQDPTLREIRKPCGEET